MAITPAERTALVNAISETAMAVNDRVNATTAQQRQAALDRYNNGWRTALLIVLNAAKHGQSGDYE